VRLPVFLGRRPEELADHDLAAFYQKLLKAVDREVFRNGQWSLCERSGWPDNQSFLNLLAWCWVKDDDRFLIVINYSYSAAQGLVRAPWDDLRGKQWRLNDQLSGESYDRSGDGMRDNGLYMELKPWGCNVFEVKQA
jgi:hypothetical protein